MRIDTYIIDPLEEPERYFAEFMRDLYVPDSVQPKDEPWVIPIDADKLDSILNEM